MNLIFTQLNHQARHSSQRGYTNVQLAIGMIVAILITIGSISGYKYIDQSKVNNEINLLTDLKAATVRYGQFSGQFTTANMTTGILTGLNFFADFQPRHVF